MPGKKRWKKLGSWRNVKNVKDFVQQPEAYNMLRKQKCSTEEKLIWHIQWGT
jgi:hypothetical protein